MDLRGGPQIGCKEPDCPYQPCDHLYRQMDEPCNAQQVPICCIYCLRTGLMSRPDWDDLETVTEWTLGNYEK